MRKAKVNVLRFKNVNVKGTYILVYAQIKCKPYNEKWRIHTQHFENSNTLEQTFITHLYFRFKYGAPYGMD